MNQFKKAERRQAKLKIALTGPSGSGKTFSALSLALGMGEKVALIDTENDSAALYSDRFTFDSMVIEPPYSVVKYMDGIKAAVNAGYDVLVIDSISHAWAGEGGLLAKKESLDARGGNSFSNWGSISKEHEAFKALLLNADIHLICTMRSKQDYVLEINDKGKSAPRKVGLAPIQRDGMEYEFTTVFDIGMDHSAATSKDRTGLFDGQISKLSHETGQVFMKWLNGAKPQEIKPILKAVEPTPPRQESNPKSSQNIPPSQVKMASSNQTRMIWAKLMNELQLDDVQARAFIKNNSGKEKSTDLTAADIEKLLKAIAIAAQSMEDLPV